MNIRGGKKIEGAARQNPDGNSVNNSSLENSTYLKDRMSLEYNLKEKVLRGSMIALNVKHPHVKHAKASVFHFLKDADKSWE